MYVNNDFAAPSQIGYSGQVRPVRQEVYRAQRGGPMPQEGLRRGYDYPGDDGMMGDMGMFQDDDRMSGLGFMGRRTQPESEPLSIDPRFLRQRDGGMARGMINDIRHQTEDRMYQSKAPMYLQRPPPHQQPPAQPKITRYRTVVDEPQGYMPPTQGQGYSSQQGYTQQVAQPQQSNIAPQQVTMYYDPQTGVIQNPNQTASPQYGVQQGQPQQPTYLSYQQPTQGAAPQAAYQQQAAPQGYQFANMPQGYMMPQYPQQQQQPIVIPAQILR
jgi:hypothetical protein